MLDRLIRIALSPVLDRQRRRRKAQLDELPQVMVGPAQVKGGILLANRLELLRRLPADGVICELGVFKGFFSEAILREAKPRELHLVDVWASKRYNEDLFQSVVEKFSTQIDEGSVHIHRKLSTDAAADFDDGMFDMVYIDTDHGYQVTRDELKLYAPKVKPGGLLAGHDYVQGNFVGGFRYGVIEAVQEFCNNEGWKFAYLTVGALEFPSFALRRVDDDHAA